MVKIGQLRVKKLGIVTKFISGNPFYITKIDGTWAYYKYTCSEDNGFKAIGEGFTASIPTVENGSDLLDDFSKEANPYAGKPVLKSAYAIDLSTMGNVKVSFSEAKLTGEVPPSKAWQKVTFSGKPEEI